MPEWRIQQSAGSGHLHIRSITAFPPLIGARIGLPSIGWSSALHIFSTLISSATIVSASWLSKSCSCRFSLRPRLAFSSGEFASTHRGSSSRQMGFYDSSTWRTFRPSA
jgi:hypothetical protein